MTALQRQHLRERFGFACGYRGVREVDSGAQLTVDHFQPRSRGGSDDEPNWVLCCHACDELKGAFWDESRPLLHPLHDNSTEHWREQENGTLLALSDAGTHFIATLHLNRTELVAHRRERRERERSREEQIALLRRLNELEIQVEILTTQIKET